jgi:hypothetical protein
MTISNEGRAMVDKCIRCAQAASTNEELGALQKAALTCYDEASSVLPPTFTLAPILGVETPEEATPAAANNVRLLD